MDTVYKPSVCLQTDDEHVHYDIVMITPPKVYEDNLSLLRRICARLGGGRTAGQVIRLLQEKKALGVSLRGFQVDQLRVEDLPLTQVCHKGEVGSPAVDFDDQLFTPVVDEEPRVPAVEAKVARISRS